jgi:hypothetical protein
VNPSSRDLDSINCAIPNRIIKGAISGCINCTIPGWIIKGNARSRSYLTTSTTSGDCRRSGCCPIQALLSSSLLEEKSSLLKLLSASSSLGQHNNRSFLASGAAESESGCTRGDHGKGGDCENCLLQKVHFMISQYLVCRKRR